MIRLAGAHRGDRALVILGGPSIVARGFDFGSLRGRGFVTFVETKALTPYLLHHGFEPDYYLMLFPEKSKDNALQNFIYRSKLAEYRIDPFLKPCHRDEARDVRSRLKEYLEPWQQDRGPFKRFRWRPDVYLPGSPYELLDRVPRTKVIVNRAGLDEYFPHFAYGDRAFYYRHGPREERFDADKYFHPVDDEGVVSVRCADTFLNSAAIALYPLLNYMGFQEVYFLGMDMSMLGSLEYGAPFTFRSMAHYWWFFRRTMRAFNAHYRPNGWFFARPRSEFDDLKMLWSRTPMAFTRVYEPWRYATPIDGLSTMPIGRFMTI